MKTELTLEESRQLIDLGVDPKLASKEAHSLDDRNQLVKSPVFQLSDILAILPKGIGGYHLTIEATDDEYDVTYQYYDRYDGYDCLPDEIIAAPELIDSLYQLLIWCIENHHYNPKNEEECQK